MSELPRASRPAIVLRAVVLAAIAALSALIVAWALSASRSGVGIVLGIAATLPLLAFVPTVRRGVRRGYAALTLCLVPYLAAALTELVANPAARVWASAMLLLSFGLFVLSIAFLRATRAQRG